MHWGEDPFGSLGSGNPHPGAGWVSIWMCNSLESSGLPEAKPMSQLEANLSVQHSQDVRIF